MAKYRNARNRLRESNNICPAISKPQVLDMKSWPCPPPNNLEDARNAKFDKNRFSEMTKYKNARSKLGVANNIRPTICTHQVLDMKS